MPQEWISVVEASRRLGVSVATVRRMIEAGKLEAERELIGGSRDRYRVRMPRNASASPESPESGNVPPDASPPLTEPGAAILGLLADLREMRRQQRDDASRIAALSERAAAAETRAELEAARADDLAGRLANAEERLQRPRWRRLWGE
jgi:excisionase family DNA binding protein